MEDIDRLIQGLTILRKYVGDLPCPIGTVDDVIIVYTDKELKISTDDFNKLKHTGWWPTDFEDKNENEWMWG